MATHGAAADLSPDQVRAALAHVRSGQQAAARRLPTPWWFHPVFAVALAAMVGSFSLARPAATAVLGCALLAQVGLYAAYRRLTGVWLNLMKVPRMRRPALLAAAVAYALMGAGALLELAAGLDGGFALAGAVLGACYVGFWRWVERELARTWRAGP